MCRPRRRNPTKMDAFIEISCYISTRKAYSSLSWAVFKLLWVAYPLHITLQTHSPKLRMRMSRTICNVWRKYRLVRTSSLGYTRLSMQAAGQCIMLIAQSLQSPSSWDTTEATNTERITTTGAAADVSFLKPGSNADLGCVTTQCEECMERLGAFQENLWSEHLVEMLQKPTAGRTRRRRDFLIN